MASIKNEDFTEQNLIIELIENGPCDKGLKIKFANGRTWEVYDNGQKCCERRYMNIQDDLSYHTGAQLFSISLGESSIEGEKDYRVKAVQFLIIKTSKGTIVVSNHNDHNGYYGGFDLVIEDVTKKE